MRRFIGKKITKRYVRPNSNRGIPHKVAPKEEIIEKKTKETDMNDKIEQVKAALDIEKAPKRKVKVEKKDKGLYERTEESTILLTEDNKMLLND